MSKKKESNKTKVFIFSLFVGKPKPSPFKIPARPPPPRIEVKVFPPVTPVKGGDNYARPPSPRPSTSFADSISIPARPPPPVFHQRENSHCKEVAGVTGKRIVKKKVIFSPSDYDKSSEFCLCQKTHKGAKMVQVSYK